MLEKENRRSTQEPLTLLKKAAEMASAGLTARMTSVSFQPVVKPMMKAVMKVVYAWISSPTLSPMPSWIL